MRPRPRSGCCALLRVRTMAGGLLDDPAAHRRRRARRRPRPGRAGALVRDRRGRVALQSDVDRRARAVAGRPGAQPQARRPARATPLHRAELRDRPRRRRGAAFALPGFNPVEAYEAAIANLAPELVAATEAGDRAGAAGVGRRAARHGGGRSRRAARRGRRARCARPGRPAAARRRGLLLDARLSPARRRYGLACRRCQAACARSTTSATSPAPASCCAPSSTCR